MNVRIKTFFIRLSRAQLEAIMAAIFFVPLVIVFTFLFYTSHRKSAPGPDVIVVLYRTMGVIGAFVSIFTFAWQRATSRYLYDLLGAKENTDYEQYNRFNIVMLIIALLWALLFWTGYIGFIAYLIVHHTWVLIPVFILIITSIYFLRSAFSFRFKACEALLKGIPYHSVKARFFPDIFYKSWSSAQNTIREVYQKYGDKKLA